MPGGHRRAVLLALWGLAGCVRAPVGPVVAVAPAAPAPGPVAPAPTPVRPDALTLERTACSGSCPVYSLTVWPDGRVHFVGVADVALVGERDWRIEPAYAKHLFGEVQRAGFGALAPRYSTEVEELPGLVLTLTRDGHTHRVQLGGEGSAELPRELPVEKLLQRLALTVDKLTGSGPFVEVASKRKGGGCTE